MACTFIGKKRRKDKGTCLVALGSDDGDVLAINVFTGEMKWKSKGRHPGGIINLSFANEGRRLRAVGANGIASEMNSETGEIIKELKLSKKSISSSVCSCDEKVVAAAATARVRLFSLEDGKELVKLSTDLGSVQHISVSDDAKAIVTSGIGEKHLQVWKLELSIGSVSSGPILSMRHSPLTIECKNGCSGEDGLVVLSVSDSGVAYIWNLKTSSDDDVKPIKITIKANKAETDLHNSGRARKSRISIIAARIHALESNGQVTALITYGSADSPQFSLLDIPHTGEDIVITATEGAVESNTSTEQNGVPAGTGLHKVEAEAGVRNEKSSKKRAASDLETVNTEPLVDNGHGEPMDRVQTDDDLDEPTMGEKLADLNLVDDNKVQSHEQKEPSPRTKPPSADSVHVLLKQALHADDRVLLLDCLYRKDEKVVANSVSLLNPSDVLKLLQSLVSIIQSRGAVLACALPWLRSLLLQHASGIMSQESSLLALHSLYQLVESRVSNFTPALQLSSSLDLLYAGTVDDEGVDENDVVEPFIFEDKDESDEEESEDAMETDEEDDDTEVKTFSDVEGIDGMSD